MAATRRILMKSRFGFVLALALLSAAQVAPVTPGTRPAELLAAPAGAQGPPSGAKLGPLLRLAIRGLMGDAAVPGGSAELAARERAPWPIVVAPAPLPIDRLGSLASRAGSAARPRRRLICHALVVPGEHLPPQPGVRELAWAGDAGLLALTPEAALRLASLPTVTAIELASPMELKNDVATVETGARLARGTFATSGAGTIIGFIGSGADVTHPDFIDGGGGTRILYLLDLSQPGDVDGDGVLDGPDFFGGTLYTKSQIDSALAGERTITGADERGHETHVMGVAAGNGRATGNGFPVGTFAGVAPEAGIVVVKSSLAGAGLVGPGEATAGLAFVDSLADEMNLPYVVNMSFGTQLSAHDGTDMVERFIDNTVGRGVPGKAVVVSAGNEGSNYGDGPFLHCSRELSPGEEVSCEVRLPAYTPGPGSLDDGMILDLWYGAGDEMTVTVESPGGEAVTAGSGETRIGGGADGSVYIENAAYASPYNNDNECFIQIDDGDGADPATGTWIVTVRADAGGGGRFDLWLAYRIGLGGPVGFTAGSPVTNERLVATPGNSREAITVGSYTNRESWRDLDNNLIYFGEAGVPPAGEIAPGSSPGPTRDGRDKPELVAPGRAVISALSRDAYPGAGAASIFAGCGPNAPRCLVAGDGRHAVARGTSFAAPHVAGAIALLLEMRPSLDAEQLKNVLAFAARDEDGTGGPWGYGKIDVQAASETISALELVASFSAIGGPGGVLVSWSAAPGATIEGFRLYRSPALRGPYEIIHSSSGIEGSFLDPSVAPGSRVFYRLGVLLPGGVESAVAPISAEWGGHGPLLSLLPPSPNPSSHLTTVRFSSSITGTAVVRAFDAAGRLVRRRTVRVPQADAIVEHLWLWTDPDGDRVAAGVYYITVEVAGARAAAKIVVLP
jgi:hypothetical protein